MTLKFFFFNDMHLNVKKKKRKKINMKIKMKNKEEKILKNGENYCDALKSIILMKIIFYC